MEKTIWTHKELPEPGKGLITFKLKTNGNFFLRLAIDGSQNSKNSLYEVNLGADNNSKTLIRVAGRSAIVAESSNYDLSTNSLVEKEFWINIHQGRINVGTQDADLDFFNS